MSNDVTPSPTDAISSVSAIVVSYHTGAILDQALDALLQAPELAELILVDNGNPPPVLAKLAERTKKEPRLRVLSGHGNLGFAAGCNLGARTAGSDFLLFLNPDCLLPPGGLARLLADTRTLPRPWLAGGRLINPDGSEQRGSRRGELTPASAVVEGLRLDRIWPARFAKHRFNWHEAQPTGQNAIPVPVISGACIFVHQEDFWAIGGWDEGYFLHVEDIDLCHRFRRAGGTVYHLPQVVLEHSGATSDAPGPTVEWHKAKGFIRYFDTHFAATTPAPWMWLLKSMIFGRFLLRAARSFFTKK